MKKLYLKYKKIIWIFLIAIIIFGATGTAISFATKANESSISKATRLANEFYENIGWNDVESMHKELVSSYEERLNNDAEYEDLRNDPNHTISEYVSNFNNFLKYEILDKKLKKYPPRTVYEELWEISQEYKLNVLDWEYAINYSQLVIDNSAKEINGIPNLSKEQKIAINKNTSGKIEYSFREAKSRGWTALEFINHFTTSMSSEIKNQRNALAEKAITNNKLLEFLSSQKLKINEQVLPNNLEIDLEKLTLNSDVSHLLPYLFKYNGYPVDTDTIDGFELSLTISENEKINVFQRKFSFWFSLIKKNSDFFIDAPAKQEMKNLTIFESNNIQDKLIQKNILEKPFVELQKISPGNEAIPYTEFISKTLGHENDIPFDLLKKMFKFNIDMEYKDFFTTNLLEKNEGHLYRIVGKVISVDSSERTAKLSLDIQNIKQNKMLSEIFSETKQLVYDVQFGLTEDEQWETIVFLSEKIQKIWSRSEVSAILFSMWTDKYDDKISKKTNFDIAFLTTEAVALVYYTAMAVVQWINAAITCGACFWSAVTYTATAIATLVTIVFLSLEEKNNVLIKGISNEMRNNEIYVKTQTEWINNPRWQNKYDEWILHVSDFYSSLESYDPENLTFSKQELLDLYGGENNSLLVASEKLFLLWGEYYENFLIPEEISTLFGFALAENQDTEMDPKYFKSALQMVNVISEIIDTSIVTWHAVIQTFARVFQPGREIATLIEVVRAIWTTKLTSWLSFNIHVKEVGKWFGNGRDAFKTLYKGFFKCIKSSNWATGLKQIWRNAVDLFAARALFGQRVLMCRSIYDVIMPVHPPTQRKIVSLKGYKNVETIDMVLAGLIQSPWLLAFEFVLAVIEISLTIVSFTL